MDFNWLEMGRHGLGHELQLSQRPDGLQVLKAFILQTVSIEEALLSTSDAILNLGSIVIPAFDNSEEDGYSFIVLRLLLSYLEVSVMTQDADSI